MITKGRASKRNLKARRESYYSNDLSNLSQADWGENNYCKPKNYLWLILIAIILLVIGVIL